jgi:carbamoyltransferase
VPRGKDLLHRTPHAAAAFLTSPSQRAAILTADGVGEWATVTVGLGQDAGGAADITCSGIRYPHSLGMLYTTFTAYWASRSTRRIQGHGTRRLRPASMCDQVVN